MPGLERTLADLTAAIRFFVDDDPDKWQNGMEKLYAIQARLRKRVITPRKEKP